MDGNGNWGSLYKNWFYNVIIPVNVKFTNEMIIVSWMCVISICSSIYVFLLFLGEYIFHLSLLFILGKKSVIPALDFQAIWKLWIQDLFL